MKRFPRTCLALAIIGVAVSTSIAGAASYGSSRHSNQLRGRTRDSRRRVCNRRARKSVKHPFREPPSKIQSDMTRPTPPASIDSQTQSAHCR